MRNKLWLVSEGDPVEGIEVSAFPSRKAAQAYFKAHRGDWYSGAVGAVAYYSQKYVDRLETTIQNILEEIRDERMGV